MTQLMEPRSEDRTTRLPSVSRPQREPRATKAVPLWRRVIPALSIAVMVMAFVYATVPFTFAGAVQCQQHGLSGATAAPGTPAGTIIGDMNLRCAEAGNSRIAVGASAAGLALMLGLGAAFAPTTAEVNARRPLDSEGGWAQAKAKRSRPVPVGAGR